MWTELSTVEACLPCRQPFSFFFDVVETYWKASSSNRLTLHRICTLARKQGASFLLVETALGRTDVLEEIDDLDASYGDGGAAEAISISFFTSEEENEKLCSRPIASVNESDFLGQVTLINYRPPGSTEFKHSYVFEAVLSPPAHRASSGVTTPLLNNFVGTDGEFKRPVRGREFSLRGIFYCQQNGRTNVCAHASLRMALNSILGKPIISSRSINTRFALATPVPGLSLGQIKDVIDSVDGVSASVVPCEGMSATKYLTILSSVVESGHAALLVFTTSQDNIEHVVTVFGHTRNSDEWHPEAIPAYAGPASARFYSSSAWIDHFLIHDDNFGPYYALSSRALEVDAKVRAQWIIALHPVDPTTRPEFAEGAAAAILANWLPTLAPLGEGKWFELITQESHKYVLRTILIEKTRYLAHLTESVAHDGTKLSAESVAELDFLPEWFWMVEFSLPALYTGNRSKLGEVIIDAFASPNSLFGDTLLALRMPSLLAIRDEKGFVAAHTELLAHSPIYERRNHLHVW